jgi:hypothetical protein
MNQIFVYCWGQKQLHFQGLLSQNGSSFMVSSFMSPPTCSSADKCISAEKVSFLNAQITPAGKMADGRLPKPSALNNFVASTREHAGTSSPAHRAYASRLAASQSEDTELVVFCAISSSIHLI